MSSRTFESFFKKATGSDPFPYQSSFAKDEVLPDLLAAPTGAGKTATAVLGWLWRRRFAKAAIQKATPRRLVFCLPMRTLVDQTENAARDWIDRLGLTAEISVYALLGGRIEEEWEESPERDAVIIGTQDQLLSRALNRGYAMTRYMWPVHFGLLNNDCLWVMDEVQLMGPGLSTSAQLQAFRDQLGVAAPTKTIWMSATLDPAALGTIDLREKLESFRTLSLSAADRRQEGLKERLRAKKAMARAKTRIRPDTDAEDYAHALARELLAHHVPETLTLVIVNQVARAQAVYRGLVAASSDREVALIHSRFRPADRGTVQRKVLAGDWSGILVATQAIEAGVDISARTLVSELAPWSSMVQRFGRCNRRGEFRRAGEANVLWIDVDDEAASPYSPEELKASRSRLKKLEDVGPTSLESVDAPPAVPALPVVRRRDLLELFDTQPDLAGHDIDVSRFVRATNERDVQVAWRPVPADGPPENGFDLHRDELCRVPVDRLRKLIGDKGSAYRWDALGRRWERPRELVPGMTVIVPLEAGGYSSVLGFTGDRADKPEPAAVPALSAEADDDDPLTLVCSEFVTLQVHSQDVTEELERLASVLGDLAPWELLGKAARWHDLGKTHDCFQRMLLSGVAQDDSKHAEGPWAKSDGRRCKRGERPHFRHELASALALLAQGGDDLCAYLVAAHHGKVRMSIRARPTEKRPTDDRKFALGVWEGDLLPRVDLGGGVTSEPVELDLDVAVLGDGAHGASWSTRAHRLLEQHGPFRLACWEALVRVADWRGTARRCGPREQQA